MSDLSIVSTAKRESTTDLMSDLSIVSTARPESTMHLMSHLCNVHSDCSNVSSEKYDSSMAKLVVCQNILNAAQFTQMIVFPLCHVHAVRGC